MVKTDIDTCVDLNKLEDEKERAYDDCNYFNDCSKCPRRFGYEDVSLFSRKSCELNHLSLRIDELTNGGNSNGKENEGN